MANLFRTGQTVGWSGAFREIEGRAREEHGNGPFVVVGVEDIDPNDCNCGGRNDDKAHENGCPFAHMRYGTIIESVGHPQFIAVTTPSGKPVGTTWSGALFKPA